MMVVVAIFAILTALATFALGSATRSARISGQKFDIVQLVQFARTRAQVTGSDVYVVFANLDSRDASSREVAPRVLVYEDANRNLRLAANADNLMPAVLADELNIREDITGAGRFFGETGLAFVPRDPAATVPACSLARLPTYIPVTGDRMGNGDCTAWCTFCEVQPSGCTGAIRFTPDGMGRIVTRSAATGTGGVLQLLDASDPENGDLPGLRRTQRLRRRDRLNLELSMKKNRNAQRGFSLIEVMISMVILAVGILGVAQMQILASNQNGLARRTSRAAAIARDFVETAQRWTWNDPRLPVVLDASGVFTCNPDMTNFPITEDLLGDERTPDLLLDFTAEPNSNPIARLAGDERWAGSPSAAPRTPAPPRSSSSSPRPRTATGSSSAGPPATSIPPPRNARGSS